MINPVKRTLNIVLVTASLGWALVVFSQGSLFAATDSTKVIGLKECLTMALDYSPRLRTAALEQQRLRYKRTTTLSSGLPQVNASGTFDDYLSLPTSLIPGEFFGQPGTMIPVQFGTKYNLAATIDASQLLYSQAFLTSMRLADMMLDRNMLDIEKMREEVVFNVASLYFLTQAVLVQKQNQQQNLARLDTMVTIARYQYENGLIKRIDLDRINVNRMNLQTAIENLETVYQQQLSMLKYYMGLDQAAAIGIPVQISDQYFSPTVTGSFDNHIDMRLIRQDKAMTLTNINLTKAGYIPSLAAYGRYNYSSQDNTFTFFGSHSNWYEMALVGIRLDIPVFDGLRKNSEVRQSKVMLRQLDIQEEETRKTLGIQLADAARKLKNSRDAWVRQGENVKLAEQVFSVSEEQYNQGMITITDVLTTQTDLSEAQVGLVRALVQMKNSELDYMKANGNILTILN
jgi:outer membrane protein